jgi:PleD family two-component response regulator
VISQVGEGSCFSIILPHIGEIELTKPQNAQNIYVPKSVAQSVPQSKAQPSHAHQHHQINGDRPDTPLILLVEDNLINIRLYADYLINQGYNLIFAANGQESVEMAIDQVPDLIIMDIQMPILDGFGAIQQIREHRQTQHIPIVALTA